MDYRLLGNSGLRVSEFSLGTMTFGEDWGWGSPKEEAKKIYDAYREAGGNFIDTANVYTNGSSERLLGDFLQGHRDEVVLATKYTNAMPGSNANAGGNHRKSMVTALEASLKRLKTDYIDLYWLHIWDQLTPVDEVMRAFDDMVARARYSTPASLTLQHGGWRKPTLSPPCEDGLLSRGCRSNTVSSSELSKGNCCRWPRRLS